MDNPAVPETFSTRPAPMLLYASLFCVSHFGCALFLGSMLRLTGTSMPGVGLLIVTGACYLVSYAFARRERRLFTRKENWRLTLMCCIYLVAFSVFVDLGGRSSLPPEADGKPIGDASFFDLVALDCLLYVLGPLLVFEFGAARFMRRYLQQNGHT
jgi:hypothetical protein